MQQGVTPGPGAAAGGFDKFGAFRALQRYPMFRYQWSSNFFANMGGWT